MSLDGGDAGKWGELPPGRGFERIRKAETGEPPAGPRFERIRNVETGETRTAVVRPGEHMRECGVTHCLGQTSDGESFLRQRDGSGQKWVGGSLTLVGTPARDRFYVATYGTGAPAGVGLYDLVSGKSGSLGRTPEGIVAFLPFMERAGRLLSYRIGDDRYLIDLSKIR
ncbi:hypothetical protein ABGB18_15640 [Nonomuraea sp. B12E4]|uniref:hypothetical protein n=1 Tax=Nonomuraea sp. B12E4 TaxID=3153564 RepID=UPI00325DFAFA